MRRLAFFALWMCLLGCDKSMKPEDQAALTRIGASINTARERTLTAEEADADLADLQQLGISLQDARTVMLVREAWQAVQPIATTLILDWLAKGST